MSHGSTFRSRLEVRYMLVLTCIRALYSIAAGRRFVGPEDGVDR